MHLIVCFCPPESSLLVGNPHTFLSASDVVNGQKNTLTITVEKVSDRDVTVTKIAGALLDPDTNVLIKNVCKVVHRPELNFANYMIVDKSETQDSLTSQNKISNSICLPQRVSRSNLYLGKE